jgi:hypothetical protein
MTITGRIDGWLGHQARIEARIPSGSTMATIAFGEVSSVGEFVLDLPSEVDGGFLQPLRSVIDCPTFDAPGVAVAQLGALTVIEDRVEYDVAVASSAAAVGLGGGAGGTERATFWYVVSEVDVQGRCDQPVRVWDAALSRGWNVVVSSIDDGEARFGAVEAVPPSWRWYVLDAVRMR